MKRCFVDISVKKTHKVQKVHQLLLVLPFVVVPAFLFGRSKLKEKFEEDPAWDEEAEEDGGYYDEWENQ